MSGLDAPCGGAVSWQLFLECPLDDLLDPCRHGAAEQPTQQREITRDVHRLGIDSHLNPESYTVEPDLVAVGRPHDLPDQRSAQAVDLVDCLLHAAPRLLQGASVL